MPRLAGDAQSLSRRERDHIAEVEGSHDRIDAVIAAFVPVCMDTEIEIDLGRRLHGEDIHLAHSAPRFMYAKRNAPEQLLRGIRASQLLPSILEGCSAHAGYSSAT
jgi:hypothetical protein